MSTTVRISDRAEECLKQLESIIWKRTGYKPSRIQIIEQAIKGILENEIKQS